MKRYLDSWTSQKIGVDLLTREAIESYQLSKINETLKWAVANSPFYASRYENRNVKNLAEFGQLPFTWPNELKENGLDMVCVPQHEISRIVTLDTSGTTGKPKRVFFTEEDQELTVDFFHNGMQLLIDADDTVMVLMPCRMEGSVGDLLRKGVERIGAKVIPYGLPERDISDSGRILEMMEKEQVTCTVALAAHMAELAGKVQARCTRLRCTLLSADYVSDNSRKAIRDGFGCDIYEHYGLTESGLGGAVSCVPNEAGYHVREADLYFEIIDPDTGMVVPDGQFGEIVLTTLTRKGMPFIRYRTGDISRWLPEACSCGSIVKRLDRVGDRGLVKGGLV